MTTTLAWGEDVEVLVEFGFPVNVFTLDSAEDGILDQDYLDGTLIGDDISEFCKSVSIKRGRPDQLQQFNAGTCTVVLNNTDRRFDPINEDSPYWDPSQGRSGVTPRRKIAISSKGERLFAGRITDIDISYSPTDNATADNSECVITASDDFVLLANTSTEGNLTPANELSGSRVSYILDLGEVNYPATRSIAPGTVGLGTYQIDAGTNALTYLQEVATAEQGYFFVAANGDLTFTNRTSASFVTVEAEFSDDGTKIPYTNLDVIYGQEFLYNKIIASVVGGPQQIQNDVNSQTEFGISTLTLSDLLLDSDTEANNLAIDLLGKYAQPEYRFDRLKTIYNNLSSANQLILSKLEISDVIEITRSYPVGVPAAVTKAYSIESISHEITPSSHTVEFGLAVSAILSLFILDDPVFGTLDALNALS